jgi:hypothetical protein
MHQKTKRKTPFLQEHAKPIGRQRVKLMTMKVKGEIVTTAARLGSIMPEWLPSTPGIGWANGW